MKWFYNNILGQLTSFIIGVIVVPNILEEIVMAVFQFNFDSDIWYEILDTSIMLIVGIPFMWWLLKKMDTYVEEMERLVIQRREINDELMEKNNELTHLAYYDQLTGLPNRRKMHIDIQERITKMTRLGSPKKLAVILFDLDRFQQINDIMGHAIGDKVLCCAAERLKERLPDNYQVYRHMTDEFVVLAEIDDIPDATMHKKPFMDIFKESYNIDEEEIFVTVSAGVSLFPDQSDDSETLLRQADQALSAAKANGGDQYQLFDPELAAASARKLKLENGLRRAAERNEFVLHYQPQVELESGRIIGVEALARWVHPELGLISPYEFIPIAEETGEIISLGRWVVKTACKQLREWQDQGHHLVMAINVSPIQMKRLKFPGFVASELKKNGLSPEALEIEVTESLMQNLDESKRIFNDLKELGVKISIDDFGTGYSSLSVLGAMPIDHLKIDQAFVRFMDTNPKLRPIVKTIIQLGENLGVELIAEGIEEQHIAEELTAYGCRYGQGYLYSRPVPPEEIVRMIEQEHAV
ncbi:bifunctional diguanylate cyclase/phosphodiesterase [Aciduricibacillus chroicocephali]|uniref:Bifunctional diguanylate cyclase/phosphodiesterase n=1 Tax=Aciduricibacillus chroicocephali TaxID=3054939 RepID=A0ABY9KUK6_9BACI|nr:bifunctional diguanylate cyclase/phosphodiesterase [Bacillaceae bacterium 44XB]